MASEHGGLNYSELRNKGINPDDVIDFSVSINPEPLAEKVSNAIHASNVIRYPDSGSSILREKIAIYNKVKNEEVLVVNGTSQGMFLIVSSLLNENETVCIVEPTYSEYEDACRLKTENIVKIPMKRSDNFFISSELIISRLVIEKPALLWLCSPNNPTGIYLNEKDFEKIRQACVEIGTIFILDEAYVCFIDSKKRFNPLKKNVIVLRSMTKDFGIPGLRLGYLLGEADIIAKIKKWQPEWSLCAPAQDAGAAAFNEITYYENSWKQTVERREKLKRDIETLGLRVFESCTNFFLIEVDHIEKLKAHLWKDLILVRDCASFQLKNTIRIGVRTESENNKLVSCMREFLKQ